MTYNLELVINDVLLNLLNQRQSFINIQDLFITIFNANVNIVDNNTNPKFSKTIYICEEIEINSLANYLNSKMVANWANIKSLLIPNSQWLLLPADYGFALPPKLASNETLEYVIDSDTFQDSISLIPNDIAEFPSPESSVINNLPDDDAIMDYSSNSDEIYAQYCAAVYGDQPNTQTIHDYAMSDTISVSSDDSNDHHTGVTRCTNTTTHANISRFVMQ